MKIILAITVLTSVIYGEIVHGIDTLDFIYFERATALDFALDKKFILNRIKPTDVYFFSCETVIDSGDLFVMDNIFYSCACPCRAGGGLGSVLPFYRAKNGFSSLILTKPLNILDNTIFNKIDTVRIYNNTSCCYLPFDNFGDQQRFPGDGFVLKTIKNKYVLFKVKGIDTTVTSTCMSMPRDFTILKGLIIEWYLQNDSSLDFSQIVNDRVNDRNIINIKLIKNNYKIGFIREAILNNAKYAYSLSGNKINIYKYKNIKTLIIFN